MIRVEKVRPNSLAKIYGVLPEDELQEINFHSIRDIIDFHFYSADENLKLKFRRKKGKSEIVEIKRGINQDLGLVFHDDRIRGCGNKCIFCFVDQLPRGLRKPLYFKDEDFRLSFLKGNFITLTNTSNNDIIRIKRQRLNPLYTSVHAVNEALRKKMLGNSRIPLIVPLIRELVKGRIELHTQIVLCPGINDGKHLRESIEVLSSFYPYVKSIAIVPVGLTKFRQGLFPIKPVTKSIALKIIKLVGKYQKKSQRKYKSNLVYLADEFFLLAGLDIPKAKYYDGFWQIENGVGLLREFIDDFEKNKRRLPLSLKRKIILTLVTGRLASTHIKKMQRELNRITNLKVRVITVRNDFLGRAVSVSGLLSGRDIIEVLKKKRKLGKVIILPPDCVNYQGKFLDDLEIKDIEKSIKRKVLLGSYNMVDTILKAIKHSFKSKEPRPKGGTLKPKIQN
jgi:putative radical SAM enzyme (TIGR03279 family)